MTVRVSKVTSGAIVKSLSDGLSVTKVVSGTIIKPPEVLVQEARPYVLTEQYPLVRVNEARVSVVTSEQLIRVNEARVYVISRPAPVIGRKPLLIIT